MKIYNDAKLKLQQFHYEQQVKIRQCIWKLKHWKIHYGRTNQS